MTLGTAATSSTRKASGGRTHAGASSARKIAAPMPRGTAISSASSDDTTVPYTNGRTPNRSATGSHVEVTRRRQPNSCIAPSAVRSISTTIAATSTTSVKAASRSTPRRMRSPRFRGAVRTAGCGITTNDMVALPRPHQRLAVVGDLCDLRLDLLDDRGRKRRIEQVVGVLLTFMAHPPEELRERAALQLVGLILIDEQPRKRCDRIRVLARRVGE